MKNLTVENIYTRQAAKVLTRKNFWRMLGMLLLASLITAALTLGGTYLMALATETPMETAVTSMSYSWSVDTVSAGTAFTVGYAVLMILGMLLSGGLTLGLLRATIDMARGEEKVPVRRVFGRMKYLLKYFGLTLWIVFKVLLWALVVLVPVGFIGFGIAVAGDPQSAQLNETTTMLSAALMLLAVISLITLIVMAALRYSQAPYVLADEPSTGVFECVRKSKAMMKGHKWQLFKLCIPYVLKLYGWMFLIVIVLSIVMGVTLNVQADVASIVSVVVTVIGYVLLLWKMLVYMLRCMMAGSVFFLKRKGELPAVPPEEEERIVAWQPAAERTAAESVATDAANIGCWNPGGEIKSDKE